MRIGVTPGEAVAAYPRLAEHPPRVRYDGFSCEGSVVESAQVLGLLVRDWCGLVPGRKEES
jgi:hypothetical protein